MKKVVLTVLGLLLCSIISVGQELPGNLPWEPNWNAGSSTMTVFGVVMIDGIEQRSESLVLAAFCTSDGECRDAQLPFYDDIDDRWYYMAGPSGDPGDEFTFKLFDSSGSGTILDLNCMFTIQYTEDPIGFDEAFEFTFATPSGPQPTTYELYIPGYGAGNTGGYYLIASPVTVAPVDVAGDPQGMTQGNFDLYYFDNSQEREWINYTMDENGTVNPDFGNLVPGKGFLYAREESTELQFSGVPYSGNGTFGLAYTENNQNMGGWNLMGNPYNYNVSVDKEHFYVMNEDGDNIIVAPDNTPILPMQGFFVLATRTGETVTFEEWVAPIVPMGEVVMNLSRNRGTIVDRAIVHLEGNSTLPKFMLNPNSTKIYIEQGGDDYAVVSSIEDEIPVSFKAASNGTYTLNVAVQNAELDYLHLVDNLAGTDTDLLANPNYTFEANTGDYASRFTLVLRTTTGLVEHFAFYNGHNWTISNDGEALIQVVDVMGRILNSKEICGNAEINISQPAGVYMLRLVNGTDVKVQKVVVR